MIPGNREICFAIDLQYQIRFDQLIKLLLFCSSSRLEIHERDLREFQLKDHIARLQKSVLKVNLSVFKCVYLDLLLFNFQVCLLQIFVIGRGVPHGVRKVSLKGKILLLELFDKGNLGTVFVPKFNKFVDNNRDKGALDKGSLGNL